MAKLVSNTIKSDHQVFLEKRKRLEESISADQKAIRELIGLEIERIKHTPIKELTLAEEEFYRHG